MLAALKQSFVKDLTCTNHTFGLNKQKRNAGTLDTGKAVPQASFFSNFFEEGHHGEYSVVIRLIDGAQDVYSLRRKELFWQYKLGLFTPNGLNERAADVELDIFACGTA